jgi:hypothetical protein
MNLRIFVGLALIVSVFAAGNILLFGLFHDGSSANIGTGDILFSFTYFLLCFFVMAFVVVSLKDTFSDRSDLFFLMFFGLLLCAAGTFTATSIHLYHEKSMAILEFQSSYSLDSLTKTNDYYANYITYLQAQIQKYRNNSDYLQFQVSQKIVDIKALPQISVVPTIPSEPVVSQPEPVAPPTIPTRHEEEDD